MPPSRELSREHGPGWAGMGQQCPWEGWCGPQRGVDTAGGADAQRRWEWCLGAHGDLGSFLQSQCPNRAAPWEEAGAGTRTNPTGQTPRRWS